MFLFDQDLGVRDMLQIFHLQARRISFSRVLRPPRQCNVRLCAPIFTFPADGLYFFQHQKLINAVLLHDGDPAELSGKCIFRKAVNNLPVPETKGGESQQRPEQQFSHAAEAFSALQRGDAK